MKTRVFIKNGFLLAILAVVSIFIGIGSAMAGDLPEKIEFKGRLTTSSGDSITDDYHDMKFTVMDAATAGSAVSDVDTHQDVTTTSAGLVNLQLNFPASNFGSSGARYLKVEVGNGVSGADGTWEELTPRQQLVSVPYTMESFTCGVSQVTFTYRGSSVTYGTVLNPTTNECWLDRNLGASQVATSSTDSTAYGDLFQWGRLDDGHQSRTSATTSTNSSTDDPGHGNFILELNSPFDWRDPQNDNLWQGVSSIPCPSGWRIPTKTEWEAERTSWGSNNSAGAYASPLKLTVAGYRSYSDGSLGGVGSSGLYWSSTVDGANARRLYFGSDGTSTTSTGRAYGFSVRCIKD